MARFQYDLDHKTGDRLVSGRAGDGLPRRPVGGQCDCGTSLSIVLSGDATLCPDCGEVYRLVTAPSRPARSSL